MALSVKNRLRSSRDFSRVHRKGKRAATKNLAMRALKGTPYKASSKRVSKPSTSTSKGINKSAGERSSALLLRAPNPKPRSQNADHTVQFGISISRKVSKRAVVRNRIKRQIKAILQQHLPNISESWQVVIVVRPAAVECSFDEFLRELEYLLKKLEIVT